MVLEQWIVQGSVPADIRVFEAISRETAGEQPRYGALDTVVLVPVDELVPDPEQGAVAGALCVARPVEEDDVVAPASLVYGLSVDPGPLLGVAVVVAPGVSARKQHGVVGESLSEVGHPPGAPVADEFHFDDVLDPGPRPGVGEIHEDRGEAGDRDLVRFAPVVLYQVAVPYGFLEEVAAVILFLYDVVTDKGVYVGHEPDVLLFQALFERTPFRVVVPVQLPVPPQLRAEAGFSLSHPILKPDGGDGRIE